MTKRSGRTPRQNKAKSVPVNNDADQKNDGAYVDHVIAPQIPPTPRHSENAQKGSGNSVPRWRRFLNDTALIAGIGYAIVTYFMWTDSRHNFATDQRAWIMLESLSGNMELDKQYIVWVSFKNFGRTPAIHESLMARMQLLAPNQAPDFRELEPVNVIANIAPNQPFAAPIKPEATDPIGTQQLAVINSGQGIENIFGRVDYRFIFGVQHWSQFCYYLERDARTYSLCAGGLNRSDDNH
jgi:hypothetical protein